MSISRDSFTGLWTCGRCGRKYFAQPQAVGCENTCVRYGAEFANTIDARIQYLEGRIAELMVKESVRCRGKRRAKP